MESSFPKPAYGVVDVDDRGAVLADFVSEIEASDGDVSGGCVGDVSGYPPESRANQ